jgi:membrane protease YdiL (CAAX protease family)
MTEEANKQPQSRLEAWRSNAWTDLALVVPIFLVYHLGVVLLDIRNAADLVTTQMVRLAENSVVVYWGLTLALGAAMATVLLLVGRGQAFEKKRFLLVLVEGVVYATVMRGAAAWAVGSLPMGGRGLGPGAGLVMSLGAGLYEEIAFRVGLFGLGALAIRAFFGTIPAIALTCAWGLCESIAFSAWHHVGALGDPFDAKVFVFRTMCGLVLTAVYALRGFAPAVWTHAVYDIWVLVL